MRALVWFRSDLRVADNTALARACRDATRGVVGLFVMSPGEWLAHDAAPCRVELLLRTLRELSESLLKRNIALTLAHASRPSDVPGLVLDAAAAHDCHAIYFNREYELDEHRRDVLIDGLAKAGGRSVISCTDQVILEPGTVRTGEGRYFTVFTPFKRAWIKRLAETDGGAVIAAPQKQPEKIGVPTPVPDRIEGFLSTIDPALWVGGEKHAQKRLRAFVSNRLNEYKTKRDFPDCDGTSSLSPYLSIGAISPRQCLRAALEANSGRADSGKIGPHTWISELIWREFYVHVMAGFPRVSMRRAFQPATERLAWRSAPAELERWKQGRTGYPLVDAAMRQLSSTGWMHNRLRMVSAMFLSKHLLIDWREGERHFMRNLVDGFLASNNGGWQWSASTGTDAAPYFRVFNPFSQSRKFDPDGDFIRKWVPELRDVDGRAVHAPHDDKHGLPPLALASLDYPEPIVDHALARTRVLAAFTAIRSQASSPSKV